ncbi:hypothetical protein, partial [Streptomyces sp. CO7]
MEPTENAASGPGLRARLTGALRRAFSRLAPATAGRPGTPGSPSRPASAPFGGQWAGTGPATLAA